MKKNFLIAIVLLIVPFICGAQDAAVSVISAPKGIWVYYKSQFNAGSNYTISRKTSGSEWEEVATITPPANFEQFKANLLRAATYTNNTIPEDSSLRKIWTQYKRYNEPDSLSIYVTQLPYIYAIGAAWYDGTAQRDMGYEYKVEGKGDDGKITGNISRLIRFPEKDKIAEIKPSYINPTRNGVYVEFEITKKGSMQTCKVYRNYYMRSDFERINPLVTFSERKGKFYAVFTDRTAVPKVPYTYMIVPVDPVGNEGEPSPSVQLFNVAANSIPPSVSHVRTTSLEARKAIKISWELPKTPDVVTVDIYKGRSHDGEYTRIASLPPSDTAFLDYDVMPVTTYFYTVTINGTYEQSVNAPRLPGTLRASNLNNVPPQYVEGGLDGNVVKLQWTKTSKDNHGYFVYRGIGYKGNMVKYSNVIVSDDSVVHWMDTLHVGPNTQAYTYAITSENTSYTESPLSKAISVQLVPAGRSSLPIASHIEALPYNDNGTRVVWTNLARNNISVKGYNLYRRTAVTNGATTQPEELLTANPLSDQMNFYIDKDLKEGYTYYYSVAATDGHEVGSKSLEAGYSVAVNAPMPVDNMQAFDKEGEVLLKWTVPMGQPLNKIHILRAATGKTPEVIASVDAGADNYSDKNVIKGNTYYYYFLTESQTGNSSKPTSPISVTVTD